MAEPTVFDMPRTDRVVQGAGAVHAIGDELRRRGLSRAYLVTGRTVGSSAHFRDLVDELGDSAVGVYDRVLAHNPVDRVAELVVQARESGADVLIAVGGGSPVDAAKLAALGVAHGITTVEGLAEYALVFEYPDTVRIRPLEATPLPTFAVPTTLSAAEWDGFCGSVDHERDTKDLTSYLELTPQVVFLDPEFAAHTPRDLWAQTGVRALDHAVEISYANNAHPFTSALTTGALRLLAANLPRSVADPHDHEAALNCQIAAWMSIIGVHNVSLGLSHAIGHQLGALGIPHGVTSCIMLPHVMRFLEPVTQEAQARMATTLVEAGVAAPGEAAADALDRLLDDLGVPRRVSDYGIPREKIPVVAKTSMGDLVVRESPRPVDEATITRLLETVW
ncbi:iron-containing alcohol dehydrogenase [Pseudonocardia benzenivorans]|uniref:iron-containing alcohol dehydrogenase n=1 Tax=Pseudonocardia benzenivorans TaxID=228005 RepID=UPI0031F981EF